jgi:hypothetical protein
MDRRQVQEVGGGTVTVSLPRDWARAHDVTPGTAVFLRPQADGVLELSPDPSEADPRGTARIDLQGAGPAAAAQLLGSAYRQGFSRVQVTDEALAESHRSALDDRVRRLPGATITAQDPDSVTVAVPMDPDAISIGQTVRSLIEATAAVFRQLHERDGTEPGTEPAVTGGTLQRKAALLARQTSRPLSQSTSPADRAQYRELGAALAGAGASGLRAVERQSCPRDVAERLQGPLDEGIELLEDAGRAAVEGASNPTPAALLDRCASLDATIEETVATDPSPRLLADREALFRLVAAARKAGVVAAVAAFDVSAAE